MTPKWYSGLGDDGRTGIIGPERVSKSATRVDALGTVDEASAFLGMARAQAKDSRVPPVLVAIQRDLYLMMADLATPAPASNRPPRLAPSRLDWLEERTREFGGEIQPLRGFILPGDSLAGAAIEICRTVVRRAERRVVQLAEGGELRDDAPLRYLNRLSSLLFVLARIEDQTAGVTGFTMANGA